MAFKYQVFLCPRPKDLLLVTYNHIDTIREFVQHTPVVVNQVDETHRKVIEVYREQLSHHQPLIIILHLWILQTHQLPASIQCNTLLSGYYLSVFITCIFCNRVLLWLLITRCTHLCQRGNSSFSDKHCSYFYKTCMFAWVLLFFTHPCMQVKWKYKLLISIFLFSLLSGVNFPQKQSPESQRTFCLVVIWPSASRDRCSRAY